MDLVVSPSLHSSESHCTCNKDRTGPVARRRPAGAMAIRRAGRNRRDRPFVDAMTACTTRSAPSSGARTSGSSAAGKTGIHNRAFTRCVHLP
jgi:hypothetical protein